MKNLFFFNQRSNAAAQATECAYTTGQKFGVNPTKTSTFGRFATYIGLVLVMLVTLGVGEMKAGESFWQVDMTYSFNGTTGIETSFSRDDDNVDATSLGTLSTGTFTITQAKWYCWADWEDDTYCFMWYNIDGGDVTNKSCYSSGASYKNTGKGNHYPISNYSWEIASSEDASGSYEFNFGWYSQFSWGNGSNTYDIKNKKDAGYKYTYKIAPPALDGSDFTVTPSNLISGTGTNDDPFIIANNSSTTFTVSADQAHDDANSALWAKFGSGSYSSTLTSGSYAKSASKTSLTIKAKYRNNSASLDGAEVTKTIYYKEQPAGITVAAGSNGTVSIDGSSYGSSKLISPITFSTNYNIYAKGNSHYDFSSWSKTSNGTNTTIGNTSSANTTVSVSAGAVTTVTANFVEHPYTITIVGGTAASATAKIVTTGTATAKAPFGMHFTGWTVPNSNFTLVGCTTSDETITFNATATGTVTANFAQTHAYIEGRFHVTNASRNGSWTNTFSAGDWQEDSRSIEFSYDSENHYYYLHTYATPKELTTNISDLTPWFYIKSSPSTSSWTNATVNRPHASGDANQQLTAAGDANKKSADGTSGSNSFRFNSTDESGYVVIGFKKFGITYDPYIYYWLEQTLEYNGNGNTGGSAPASKTYYDKGTSVQAKSNTYTKSGYSFSGWNTEANGSGSSVAASAWYTLNANTTFYAQWSENDYTVTVNAGTGGTVGASLTTTTITGHKDSKADLPTATPDPGYYFTGWTKTSGSVTFYNQSSANTAQVNGLTAAATVQANFAPLWALAGGLDGGSDWNVNDNKFTTYTTNASSHDEGQLSKSFDANSTYWVKLRNIQNSASYGLASGAATTNVYYATSSTGWTMTNASGNQKLYVHTAAAGTYDFYWDIETNQLYVHYPTSRYITSGKSDANGGTVTAVDGSGNNVWGGKFVADEATVTFTAAVNTGYTFDGWFYNSDYAVGHKYADNGDDINISGEDGEVLEISSIGEDKSVYAKFTAKTYTVTLTRRGDGYNTGGTASVTATYNATAPSIASLPTAANGYAFMGYYTEEDGEGSQIVAANGTWQNVDGYTSNGKWVRDADTELFAYFKKAEITELTLSATVVAPGTEITVTPTISPTPVGTAVVCYQVQHSNGNPLSPQPTMSQDGNVLTLTAPANSATYKIQAKLRLNDCEGTELHTALTSFQVAGEHNVTVQYKCGDLTIKASQTLEGIKPLEWSSNITAPSITGYTFQKWVQGDGVTINGADGSGEKASATIQIKAVYDGTLTAMYTKRNMIYFYNTLGWNDVWVYFYNSDEYWDNTYGSGAQQTQAFNGDHKPYWEQEHGHMTNIEGTNIWYFDYTEAGYSTRANVAFTEANKHGDQWFYNTKAVRRGDHKSSLPMFVPLADQTAATRNQTGYYNSGYWMNYPESTGYTLKIYNAWNADKSSGVAREYDFPYSADKTMPLKLDVEFNNGGNAWFMVYRNDGTYHGKNYTVTQDYNDEQALTSDNDKLKLVTSASGIYTFTLTYHDNGSGTLNYYLDIDFPVAVGDYRILYSDNATWSNGAHVLDTWKLASDVINKNSGEEAKKDTVSFFVSKGAGITAKMKFQYVSAINASTGVVTWTDVASGSITIPSDVVTKAGVYNFIVTQPAGGSSISLEKAEAYTGNYYIRTDCAGNTKWDSYKTSDHLMTYSDYAETNSGYSHYYTHWVTSGTNVKFCIANDFSLCVSDTLEGDTYTTQSLAADANIRYMWNQSTNKISRAYIAGSGDITKRFLVLEGDSKMYDEDGNELTGENQDHDKYGTYLGTDNQVILHDDENFVYERTIQVKTKARGRLSAKYNNKTQYFIGSSGDFGESTTEELLGGETSDTKYSMRIVYDFKTNRLVKAYIPSGSDITEDLAINADIMLVREHQEAGQQLTFDGGSLSEVKTVYGVLRLNRWTLNNKEKTTGHSPVGDPKSWYERSFYWISFPFDVNLSDVFGFGTYGTHWAIEEYDGAERASKGYWADNSEGFWKIIENRSNYVLKAGKGYVLAIDLALMKDNNTDFWSNGIEQVELFFPSANNVENIEATDTKTTVPSHECTIDRRTDKTTPDINKDRTKADSHWNLIGVPSYANYNKELTSDGDKATITWHNPSTQDLPYLYEWNMDANTYTPQTSSTYPFKAMHAYMVQYHGDIYWSLASATPSSPVARRAADLPQQNIEFRLELQQNNKMTDQTFVKLSDKEEVSANFAFDEDMMKEFNKGKANIYTIVENYIPTAGNTLPMSEQTTVVPVGVKIAQSGDYTFSIPDGTSGVGVTLIDTETGIRTNLSAVDYTVSLESGQNDNRFVLEISPIQHIATEIETSDIGDQKSDVRKLLIDGLLYIVRDGKVYDARGARIE